MKRGATILFLLAAWVGPIGAQEPGQPPSDDVIRSAVKAYVAAFDAHDAAGLAAQWSPDAVYVNRFTGERVTGREAITEQFKNLFQDQPQLKLDVNTESIKFLSPNVAIEHGTANFVGSKNKEDEEPVKYMAVYVQRDGKWLLDRVTDGTEEAEAPSHYEQLKEVEWMVGSWVDADEDSTIETDCNWTRNRNFLTRSYKVTIGDQVEMAGMQIVGWDPSAKTIRSWTFDSDGGFAEATWSHKGDRWFIHNHGVLADGRTASAVNIIRKIDDNTCTWQTVDRTAGGELLPNVDEVRIVRK
jgi:uncharacterized protein (TIGR02246 family)